MASADLRADRDAAVEASVALLQALVDVVSSNGWLAPALHAMELSQMVVQGLWHDDPPPLQVPHVDAATLARAAARGARLDQVFDVAALDDDVRDAVLALDPARTADVANFCNDYPNVELRYSVLDADAVVAGEPVALSVTLEREVDDDMQDVGLVRAPRFPARKREGWWLVVADVAKNALLPQARLRRARGRRPARLRRAARPTPRPSLPCVRQRLGVGLQYEFAEVRPSGTGRRAF